MNNNIKGFWFKYYVLIVLVLIGFLTAYIIMNFKDPLPSIATLSGVALTTIYFVQKQKLEEIKLFKELFTEFNARYECLNENLRISRMIKLTIQD
jgi:ABC-type iron transport system FetAB permease component